MDFSDEPLFKSGENWHALKARDVLNRLHRLNESDSSSPHSVKAPVQTTVRRPSLTHSAFRLRRFMGNFFDMIFPSLVIFLLILLFVSFCVYDYFRTEADAQESRLQCANRRDAITRFESRYRECLDILRDRNIAQLNLRLEFDRKAAAAFENCHSNSFSIEHSRLDDLPKYFYERGFALGLRRDIKRIKDRIEFERDQSYHPFSLISSCCFSSSSDDD